MCAECVDKKVKFNIDQEHIGDTLEKHYMHVLYAWCTLIYIAVGQVHLPHVFGLNRFFKHAWCHSVVCLLHFK